VLIQIVQSHYTAIRAKDQTGEHHLPPVGFVAALWFCYIVAGTLTAALAVGVGLGEPRGDQMGKRRMRIARSSTLMIAPRAKSSA
jgi:hypothetical protein